VERCTWYVQRVIRPPRIALLSSKGGSGKTTVAVAMATWWASHRGPVTLVDCDPQDTGSAEWWLDRSNDNLHNLAWAKATIPELVEHLDQLDTAVVIDTAPRLDDATLHHVAQLVDLVVIPGSIPEFPTVLQTFQTVRRASTTPTVAVITRTLTASLAGASAEEVLDVLRAEGLPIAGAVRQNNALAEAVVLGRRPDQLSGDARSRADDDLRTLMLSIGNLLLTTTRS
jgi:cellulose biosynthesis protein BcsQ